MEVKRGHQRGQRGVCRPIVNDHDLELWIGHCEEGIDAFLNGRFLVVGRYQHRNARGNFRGQNLVVLLRPDLAKVVAHIERGGRVQNEVEDSQADEVGQDQELHGSEHGVVEEVHAASLPVVTDRSSSAWTAISAARPSPGVFTRKRISPGAPRASSVSPACLRISHHSWSSSGTTLAAPGQYESFCRPSAAASTTSSDGSCRSATRAPPALG